MRPALFAPLLLALLAPAPVAAQACLPDAALSHAAAELLVADQRPSAADVLQAARDAGSDAPTVEAVLIAEADESRRERAVARRVRRFGAPVACGEARSEGRLLLLLAPRAGHLELTPDHVVVRLEEGWRTPRLFARDAEGALWQRAARPAEPVALPRHLVHPITLQLVADGPDGPRPIAERVLGEPTRTHHVPDSDEPVAARLDRLRAASGAGELRPNRRLDAVAGGHAARVCAGGPVRHVTEEGDPEQRLARAGLRARHVGETVARAADRSRAYAAMLRSPSHRSALVDRRFTDVGVGEARDGDGAACLVVLLAAWPRAVPFSEGFGRPR